MPIPYVLLENKLSTNPGSHRGRVQHRRSVTIAELVQTITRAGSTVTAAEALAFWEELSQAVVAEVQAGHRFVSDLFVVSLALTGTFDSGQDAFDPGRHQFQVRVAPGTRLRQATTGLTGEKERAGSTAPQPAVLEDFGSDTCNARLTPGGMAQLTGRRLKFNPADAAQGVFLRATDGTIFPVLKLKTNLPAQLLFMVPATLPPGRYQLEVRACPRHSTTLRVGTLPVELEVA